MAQRLGPSNHMRDPEEALVSGLLAPVSWLLAAGCWPLAAGSGSPHCEFRPCVCGGWKQVLLSLICAPWHKENRPGTPTRGVGAERRVLHCESLGGGRQYPTCAKWPLRYDGFLNPFSPVRNLLSFSACPQKDLLPLDHAVKCLHCGCTWAAPRKPFLDHCLFCAVWQMLLLLSTAL